MTGSLSQADVDWYNAQIARCEASRALEKDPRTRECWNMAILTYRHLRTCPLRHSNQPSEARVPECLALGTRPVEKRHD